ncbi:MAG: DUF2157 domain-containing protein [Alphaproteobacteria bacterium CG_4_10_14_0_2_um_filter_63_37]|nr:MAG: hypothetical protein AUJ55_05280 [Proteobacteria bacterium CG1_02_64_396]PJA25131.1 MAG: DUF2157 domain-containing protein [Alphaproteobacteria bacterium CG_4_10_14_0_2_um_filter_63_37]
MECSRKEAKVIDRAIESWEAEGIVTSDLGVRMRAAVVISPFDWHRLARYAFLFAVFSVVISAGSLLADHALIAWLLSIFNAPYWVRSLMAALIGAVLLWRAAHRRRIRPEGGYGFEATVTLGLIAVGGAIAFAGQALDVGRAEVPWLILLGVTIWGGVGIAMDSRWGWLLALIALGHWYGLQTGYVSGWGAYFLGMNYPLRFVPFGAAIIALAFLLQRHPRFEPLFGVTRIAGLFYLFVALWILSIFGDHDSWESWSKVSQASLLGWSLLFALAGIASLVYGLRSGDGAFRGFGATFLIINLYTRFFEFFWDGLHKTVFFALLAVSFWYVGSKAEAIWGRRVAPATAGI